MRTPRSGVPIVVPMPYSCCLCGAYSANVLVDPHKHAKIADFGLSRQLEPGRMETYCGTPATMVWGAAVAMLLARDRTR